MDGADAEAGKAKLSLRRPLSAEALKKVANIAAAEANMVIPVLAVDRLTGCFFMGQDF